MKKLFSALTPVVCMFSTAFAPFEAAAENCCQQQQCCEQQCCEDPCCGRSIWRDIAIFTGAAAVGAVAGVVAGNNSSGHRGKTGDTGATGAGFVTATVPPGQPGAGTAVTSLTFSFAALADISLLSTVTPFVTTPDGRTFLGTTVAFPVVLGPLGDVTISTGPFYAGQYETGLILGPGLISVTALAVAELTAINGTPASPAFDDVGINLPVGLTLLDTIFYSGQYPFPPL